jgi:hypothetical protein
MRCASPSSPARLTANGAPLSQSNCCVDVLFGTANRCTLCKLPGLSTKPGTPDDDHSSWQHTPTDNASLWRQHTETGAHSPRPIGAQHPPKTDPSRANRLTHARSHRTGTQIATDRARIARGNTGFHNIDRAHTQDSPPWTPRQDRVPRSMSIGHRIEISGARRSASPKKTIRPTLWSSEKEPVAEVQPSAPQKVQLPDSPKEQSPRFKVPEKRSPRKNTGIILGRSPRGMPQQQDAKAIVEPSETAQPASERRDIVRERIRDFEERAKLASKVAVHLANMNRQPARRTRSEQAKSSIGSKPTRRAPTQADAAERLQLPSRKPENFS